MRLSRISACLLVSLSPCLPVSPARAGDWSQWLGPNRAASSKETVAPWKGEPKVLWRKPVGEGHSSPVVSGGVVSWWAALIMFPAAALGGYAGVHTARRVPQWIIRWLVIAVGLVLTAYYFVSA